MILMGSADGAAKLEIVLLAKDHVDANVLRDRFCRHLVVRHLEIEIAFAPCGIVRPGVAAA